MMFQMAIFILMILLANPEYGFGLNNSQAYGGDSKTRDRRQSALFDGASHIPDLNDDISGRTGRILTGSSRSVTSSLTELRTSLGVVLGTVEISDSQASDPLTGGKRFYAFKGIPYARPPLGALRWTEPQRLSEPWPGGRLDATQYKSFCPQYDHDKNLVVGSEDCLYLNVFVPLIQGSTNNRLPVFVFIHGGAYTRGASTSHGPERFMREDVIVVTFNYRLGILEIPGNYAALDQVAVLRWVRSFISEFGGDPESVTLGGFSAGASYVHLHTLSPLSQGLFHRVVMISGAANCLWSVQPEPEYVAYQLADDLNCPYSSYELRQCLQLKDTETLVRAQARRSRYVYWPFEYRPVVDRYNRNRPFLSAPVNELLHRGARSTVPVLLGGTPEEGLLYALTVLLFSQQSGNHKNVYDDAASYVFESLWPNTTSSEHVSKNLKSFYFSVSSETDVDTFISEMTDALTDLLFTSCIWDAAQSFSSSQNPVYTYLMTHHDETSPSFAAPLYRLARAVGVKSPLLKYGVSHGDDVILMFDFPFALGQLSPRDEQMSLLLTSLVGNFIRTGSPQLGLPRQLPPWEPLNPGDPVYYYRLSLDPFMIQKPFKSKERNMWQQTLQLLENDVQVIEAGWRWQIGFWVLIAVVIIAIIVAIVLISVAVRKRHARKFPKEGATLRSRRQRPSSINAET